MRKLLFLLFFVFVLSTSYSLTLDKFYVDYPYVLSKPTLHYVLSSDSNVEVHSVVLNISDGLSYIPFYPNEVNGSSDFQFQISQLPCNFYGKTIQANLTVNSSDGIQNFVETFTVGDPLVLNGHNSIGVEVGNDYSVLLNVSNKGNVPLQINVDENIPNVLYLNYITPEGYSDSLKSFNFSKNYPIKLMFIGSQVGSGVYSLNLTDARCSNITAKYSANVRVYTISGEIFSYKSMDTQIFVLFLIVSSVFIVKLIKVEK